MNLPFLHSICIFVTIQAQAKTDGCNRVLCARAETSIFLCADRCFKPEGLKLLFFFNSLHILEIDRQGGISMILLANGKVITRAPTAQAYFRRRRSHRRRQNRGGRHDGGPESQIPPKPNSWTLKATSSCRSSSMPTPTSTLPWPGASPSTAAPHQLLRGAGWSVVVH